MKWLTGSSLVLILLFVIIINNVSYSKTKKQPAITVPDNEVMVSVGPEKILYSTLEQAFQKNMNRKNVRLMNVSRDSLIDFMNLYVNYRLKVLDAVNRGYDKDSAVLADIAQNRRILAESFYYDKKLVDPNVANLQKLRENEIKFAYILIVFDTKQAVPDTAEAFRKATEALNQVKSGKDFGIVATEFSDDKETAKNGGIVPEYVTGGRIQKVIEDALYAIPKEGDVYPELVKTKYGYFILKLINKVPRTKVLVRHILVSIDADTDSLNALKKADSLLSLLRNGYDFAKLAEINSDDPSSALKGGIWNGYYSRSSGFENGGKKVSAELENAIFALKDGEISNKIQTDYGFHIIRRDSTKLFDAAVERDELKKMYKRLYFEDDKKNLLDSLKYKFGYMLNTDVLSQFLAAQDTTKTILDTAWQSKIPETIKPSELYKVLNKSTSISDFVNMLVTKSDLRGTPLNTEGIKRAIGKVVNPLVFDEETKTMETIYPDFALLMKEFRDGILLFRVEALEVWDKLKFDSVLAKSFWDTTKTRYNTEPMYDISEIFVMTDSLANELYSKLKAGADFESLAAEHTQRKDYREKKGSWGLVEAKNNGLAKIVVEQKAKPGDILKPVSYEKGFSIIKVNKFEPVRQKTFEEAIPDFAPQFQDMVQKNLTAKWLNQIKIKFPVEVNNKFIDKVWTKK